MENEKTIKFLWYLQNNLNFCQRGNFRMESSEFKYDIYEYELISNWRLWRGWWADERLLSWGYMRGDGCTSVEGEFGKKLDADDNGYDEDKKNEWKNQYDDGSVDETFTILSV